MAAIDGNQALLEIQDQRSSSILSSNRDEGEGLRSGTFCFINKETMSIFGEMTEHDHQLLLHQNVGVSLVNCSQNVIH